MICLRCLAKEPARRYDSARELAEDLRLWLAGRAIHARPASRTERIWKWAKRNPVTAMLALALVVAGASGGFALHQSHGNVQRALADSRRALGESLLAQARFQRARAEWASASKPWIC